MRESDALLHFRETAQLIAENVTTVAGWAQATVTLLTGPDDFEIIALAGDEAARRELVGRKEPASRLHRELAESEDWGLLRFVPAERAPQDLIDDPDPWMVPAITTLDHPDAWQPLDLLFAPFIDEDGTVLGFMSMDVPDDGMRPGPAARKPLEKYAAQAARAMMSAYHRQQAAEQAVLAAAARDVVRRASTQQSLGGILRECERALVVGFRARGMWVQTFGDDGGQIARVFSADGTEVVLPASLRQIAEVAAQHCWSTRQAVVVAPHRPVPEMLTPDQTAKVLAFLRSIDVDSILFTPLGVGREALGNLVLTRADGIDGDWGDAECEALFGLGEALGRAIVTTHTSEQERRLIEELRALDDYRARLVGGLVEGLSHPITEIDRQLLVLGRIPALPRPVLAALSAIQRGTQRMSRVVDDLGVLAAVGDPDQEVPFGSVDLGSVVDDVLDLVALSAHRQGIELVVQRPDEPVLAHGNDELLDRLVSNLMGNAVKYSPEGGTVTVTLARSGDRAELTISDTGLGISAEDQQGLYTAFFRSTNPAALRLPGTGLGLAIAAGVVESHYGTIDLDSELGRGSTFRVTLPAADRAPGEAVR